MKTLLSTPGAPDSELLSGLRMGDEQCQAAAIRRHGARLMTVAGRFLKNPEQRREAVREAFEAAFRGLEAHEPPGPLDTWLHRLTLRACVATLRAQATRTEANIQPLLPRFDETGHRLAGPTPPAGPSRAFSDTAENRAHARACLDRLPERYRTPLLLTDIEGLDTAEAAGLLGVSAEAARVRVHQARQALCTLLLSPTPSLSPAS